MAFDNLCPGSRCEWLPSQVRQPDVGGRLRGRRRHRHLDHQGGGEWLNKTRAAARRRLVLTNHTYVFQATDPDLDDEVTFKFGDVTASTTGLNEIANQAFKFQPDGSVLLAFQPPDRNAIGFFTFKVTAMDKLGGKSRKHCQGERVPTSTKKIKHFK